MVSETQRKRGETLMQDNDSSNNINNREESYNTYLLHKILGILIQLKNNQNPPVNYPLIFMVSVITSAITTAIINCL